jgi:hypothetical protein
MSSWAAGKGYARKGTGELSAGDDVISNKAGAVPDGEPAKK